MINRHLDALRIEAKSVFQGGYPPFVMGKDPLDHIPVFSFHTVQPEEFEAQLRYLRRNGYRTATAPEVLEQLTGARPLESKTILLTFDDGRRSVWTVAYPLLKQYSFRATVFLTPGIVDESTNAGPYWGEGKGASENEIRLCDQSSRPTLNWTEIRIMHEEGIVDFQAHTLHHQRIPVSSRIVDFVHPEMVSRYFFNFTVPWMEGIHPLLDNDSILGAPVYENKPAMGEWPLYIENLEVRKRCVERVGQEGSSFFRHPRWRNRLRQVAEELMESQSGGERFESPEDQKNRMVQELKRCRQMIEERLPGHRVNQLAYPWGTGSETAVEASRTAGYECNYWTTLPRHAVNRAGDDPYRLVRLKHDFLWRLPGKGRRLLPTLWAEKLRRRISGKIDY